MSFPIRLFPSCYNHLGCLLYNSHCQSPAASSTAKSVTKYATIILDTLETKKSLVCKLLKDEVHLLYFLRRCELSLSITYVRYKSTPALYGEIQSTNDHDFSLRRRLSGNANYYSFNSRLDSFEFGHLLK